MSSSGSSFVVQFAFYIMDTSSHISFQRMMWYFVSSSFDKHTLEHAMRSLMQIATLWLLLAHVDAIAQPAVVVNEIMYSPAAGLCEWIELYNASGSEADVAGWIVHDATSGRPVIPGSHVVIPPWGYLVLARDASLADNYPEIADCVLEMGILPSLNNGGDDVVLLDASGVRVDSLRYSSSWGGGTGRSLERLNARVLSTLKSNWAGSTGPDGGTPGRKNSVAVPDIDFVPGLPRTIPAVPRTGDDARLVVPVFNKGAFDASGFTLEVYEDDDADCIANPGVPIIRVEWIDAVPSGDSVLISGMLPSSGAPLRTLVTRILAVSDERPWNNQRCDTVHYRPASGTVVINEIMYAPAGSEPEWIEVMNKGNVQADITGWSIGDKSTSRAIPGSQVVMQPGSLLVFAASGELSACHDFIPSGYVVMALPSLNNDGDRVRLIDGDGLVMDSVEYESSWGGASGKSLERIDPFASAVDRENWSESDDPERSTPGRRNSMARCGRDIEIQFVSVDEYSVTLSVLNRGYMRSGSVSVEVFADRGCDSSFTEDELLGSAMVPALDGGASALVQVPAGLRNTGTRLLAASALWNMDERMKNNFSTALFCGALDDGLLTLNEIMYAPFSGEAEWVEYINTSGNSVGMMSGSVANRPSNDGSRTVCAFPKGCGMVPPRGYLVVASDSSVFSRWPGLAAPGVDALVVIVKKPSLGLRNDGDDVVLRNVCGSTVDSVRFDPAWHNPDAATTDAMSLERINPMLPAQSSSNWSTCAHASGGTPGRRNSIYTEMPDQSTDGPHCLTIEPNPFSPDGDGFEDFCTISWTLPAMLSQVRLRVFDREGREVRSIASNANSGRTGTLIWDGLEDSRRRLRVGMYIILLEASAADTGEVTVLKRVAVVATRLD
jgi:hypothetical protein